jgi:hypothetical protein
MVLSSLELTNLSEEDKEDILSKFEEDTENLEGDDMGGEDFTDDTEVEDIQADMDVPVEGGEDMTGMEPGNGAIMDSIFKESKVDKVISKYFEVTKKEIRESAERKADKKLRIKSKVNKAMNSVTKMTETIEAFGRDCSKLPGVLKGWGAYKELKQEIDDMIEIIPLVEALAKPSIRPRHWDEIIEMTKTDIPYTSETFTLSQLLSAPLLPFKDDI